MAEVDCGQGGKWGLWQVSRANFRSVRESVVKVLTELEPAWRKRPERVRAELGDTWLVGVERLLGEAAELGSQPFRQNSMNFCQVVDPEVSVLLNERLHLLVAR
jgi:hypothetical protein